MKKSVSLILSLLMIVSIITSLPLTVTAASKSDLTFESDYDGVGYMVTYCKKSASGELVIPDTYKGKPVTYIADSAFDSCKKLTSVTIGNKVSMIAMCAFANCTKLSNVIIPKSVTAIDYCAFEACTSLESITIPDSVTSLCFDTFRDCTNLKTVKIGKGVTEIDSTIFTDCNSLESINISKNNPDYSSSNGVVFNKKKTKLLFYPMGKAANPYKIPSSVKTIEWDAFYNCTKLKSVRIPSSVTNIQGGAFNGCTKLESISIPDSVTWLGTHAFAGCKKLEKAKISNKVTELAYAVFADCTSLSEVKIPNSVKSIGSYSFGGCKNLASVSIGNGVTKIDGDAFTRCKSLKSIIIPHGIKDICDWAFFDCTNLKSVKIPNSVKNISHQAFGYYYNSDKDSYLKIKNFKIYGKKGSAAQTYAKENGFSFVAVTAPAKTKLKTIRNGSVGVGLTWSDASKAEYYEVYRKVKDGKYKYIGRTTKTSYTDNTAVSGKKYYYKVKSVNAAGKADYSNVLNVVYLDNPTMKAPSSTKSGVKLSWSKVTGAQGYVVYRKTGSGSFTKLATVKGASKVSYTDKTAKKGKKYTYKVKAYKGKNYSAFSSAKTITDKY